MKMDTVRFYGSEAAANKALVDFINSNHSVEVRSVTFTNDDWLHDFEFIGIPEREWDGIMTGLRVKTESGISIVFASWEDEDLEAESIGYDYPTAFKRFVELLGSNN